MPNGKKIVQYLSSRINRLNFMQDRTGYAFERFVLSKYPFIYVILIESYLIVEVVYKWIRFK